MATDKQPWLLSESAMQEVQYSAFKNQKPAAQLGAADLQVWKQRIFRYQQQVQASPGMEQGNLFDLTPAHADPDSIAPFILPQQNTEFWRWRENEQGVAALYFVIDYTLPILLYVGETIQSNQRWKGEHDCKRYLFNYVSAHRPHDLPVAVNIGFWPHAPVETRPRQQLESKLIHKWRSPFNKENWAFWQTPFVGEKG